MKKSLDCRTQLLFNLSKVLNLGKVKIITQSLPHPYLSSYEN